MYFQNKALYALFGSTQDKFRIQFKNFKGKAFTAALVSEPTGQLALRFAADWFR